MRETVVLIKVKFFDNSKHNFGGWKYITKTRWMFPEDALRFLGWNFGLCEAIEFEVPDKVKILTENGYRFFCYDDWKVAFIHDDYEDVLFLTDEMQLTYYPYLVKKKKIYDCKTDEHFPLELFKNAPDYKEDEFYKHCEQVAKNSGWLEIKEKYTQILYCKNQSG